MKYTKEEKIEWVRQYLSGMPLRYPPGVKKSHFKEMIRYWRRDTRPMAKRLPWSLSLSGSIWFTRKEIEKAEAEQKNKKRNSRFRFCEIWLLFLSFRARLTRLELQWINTFRGTTAHA